MNQVLELKDTRAGLASRTLVEMALLGGETCTTKLAKIGKVTEDTVRGWIKDFRRDQIAAIKQETDWLPCVTDAHEQTHKDSARKLENQIKKIEESLEGLSPRSKQYHTLTNTLLKVQRRWSEMTGIQAIIEANTARLTSEAKRLGVVKPDPKPEPPKPLRYPKSGPVVPID